MKVKIEDAIGPAIAIVFTMALSAYAIIKEKKAEKRLDRAKDETKYSPTIQDSVNKSLVFEGKEDYDADTKASTIDNLDRLNDICRNTRSVEEFNAAWRDMRTIIDQYKKGDAVNLQAMNKVIATREYCNDKFKSVTVSPDGFNTKDILNTIKTVAAINSGINNDYYKWKLASRW